MHRNRRARRRWSIATTGDGPVSRESLPSGSDKTQRVREMFDSIAPRYDLVNRLITLGLDQRWRRRTVRALALAPGSLVLDVACGTGALGDLARDAGYRVVGADTSAGMLAGRRGGSPAAQADAAAEPFADATFDGLLCGYALRNFTDLRAAVSECARVVRAGGRIAVLEVAEPDNPVLHAGHALWFRRVVPLIGAALSDPAAYRYLPDSVAYLPRGDGLRQVFRDAGFSTVGRRTLEGGLSQIITGTRASTPGRGVG
jgi:demethylmenaquinone methyltransferase/2-methoxy-6-polyprenyl-1,4-benzoquinol methylase